MRPTIAESMLLGTRRLIGASDSPRLDAELLLAAILGLPRALLLARGERALSTGETQRYGAQLARRAAGEPVAYLTGAREFYSLRFEVDARVLVPRPETELLVEHALQCGAPGEALEVLDLGTGSGAIAIAIASERPAWRVSAADIDADALVLAGCNAKALGVERIDWHHGAWYAPLAARRFHVIVSNPPYIAAGDPALQRLQAEPRIALTPGPTGLEALRAIIAGAPGHLQARGHLLVEHGHDQGSAVAALMRAHCFEEVRTCTDLAGIPRVTQGVLFTATQEHS